MTLNLLGSRKRDKARPKRGGPLRFVRDLIIIVIAALLISFLIKSFLFRSFYIPSGSMENTLQINDRIIVNELVPNVVPLERGDVVVFKDPGGWLDGTPAVEQSPLDAALTFIGLGAGDSNDHLIKRVIGLPGDHVICCNASGQLTVNGVVLDEPYVKVASGAKVPTVVPFDITVPAKSLWVMGDNRDNSRDSRYNTDSSGGPYVPYSDVVGRAFVITFPVNRWTWLDNYPSVFGDVKDAKVVSK